MITTGFPRSDATRKTEIVDVGNGVSCSDVADFPVKLSGAVSANLDGTPVVCGGFGYLGSWVYSDKCYRFKDYVWEEFATMNRKRTATAGVMHNGKLHVFGGYTGHYSLKTTETINVDGEVRDMPDLPIWDGVKQHAMTKISDTVSLLSGGWTSDVGYSAKTWFYNHDTEAFTSGPDLMESRLDHGSAMNVDKVTKAKIAVVTGGGCCNGNVMDSTEMLINGQWQAGTIQC